MELRDITLEKLGIVDAAPEPEFDSIVELASEVTQSPVTLLSIVQPEQDRQYFKAASGLPEPWFSKRETPLSHSFCQHVRASGNPLVVDDARAHPLVKRNKAVRDLNVISYLGIPIHGVQQEPIGALCAIDAKPRTWTETDVSKLKKLACLTDSLIQLRMASCISELRRHESDHSSTKDSLTNTLNIRGFTEAAKAEIAHVRRYGGDAAIAIADIDLFASVAESLGHDAGDEVIKAVGELLTNSVRSDVDVVGRYGGQEFVILMSFTTAAGVLSASKRLRECIAASPIGIANGSSASVTASFGTAQIKDGNYDIYKTIKLAQKALRSAKLRGRNCVVQNCSTEKTTASQLLDRRQPVTPGR